MANRNIIYSHSEAVAKVFHYTSDDNFDVDVFDIEDILSINTNKDINSPSGVFSIKAAPSKNWKKLVRNGDWIMIFFSKDGEKRLRMLGNIDRVSRTKEIDAETGSMAVRYMIYGRDFGKVFEKTNIYYNPFLPQNNPAIIDTIFRKEGITFSGSPNEIIEQLLSVFLGGGIQSIEILNQWFISDDLKREVLKSETNEGSDSNVRFYDLLDFAQIEAVQGYKAYESISVLSGFLWNLMKQNSNPAINEFFTELRYDKETKITKPTIYLRMIPFSDQDFTVPETEVTNDEIKKFIDLERVSITDDEIISEDVGESDHVKFNFFLITASGRPFHNEQMISNFAISDEIPKIDEDSIKKNGLLLRTDSTEFAFLATGKRGELSFNILRAWNRLMTHWFENAHKLESGTMVINGNPDIFVGKTLEVNNNFLGEKYLYYIEGYQDNWEYPGLWTTSVKLTRGRKLTENEDLKIIEDENSDDKIFTGQTKFIR